MVCRSPLPGVGKLAMVVDWWFEFKPPRCRLYYYGSPSQSQYLSRARVVLIHVFKVWLLPLLIYVPKITSVCGTSPHDSHISSRTLFQVII